MHCNKEIRLREFYNNDLHPNDRQIFREFASDNYPGINNRWKEENIEYLVLVDSYTRCIVGLLVMLPYDGDKIHIRLIVVDKEYRKRGLGTLMLRHVAEKYLKKKITLNVALDRLDLVNFYSGKGYAKIEEVSFKHKVIVFSIIHVNLFAGLPLPA